MIAKFFSSFAPIVTAVCAFISLVRSLRLSRVSAFVIAMSCAPLAAFGQLRDYVLQPGDTLQLSMPSTFSQTWDSTIDITGHIRLPFLGRQRAAGLTLTELNAQMETAATGLEIQVLQDGAKNVVVLSGSELFLQVARYRPVTVIGDIAQPGSIEFVPGMTVRALLGQAGGIQLYQLSEINLPSDATVRLKTTVQTQKWLSAQILASNLLLNAGKDETTVREEDMARLRKFLGESEAEAIADEVEIALRERLYQRGDLQERIRLNANRVANLTQAYENYGEASELEETRLQQLLEIGDKGLVTADRISDARNAALSVSTRLLTVASDIYEAQAELKRLEEDLAQLDDTFHAQALNDKQRYAQQLSEVSARVDGLRLLLSQDAGQVDTDNATVTKLLVHRGTGDDEETMPIRLGDLLYPGDVIEVVLSLVDAS
jgi:polysaccharide export outer membrane protein